MEPIASGTKKVQPKKKSKRKIFFGFGIFSLIFLIAFVVILVVADPPADSIGSFNSSSKTDISYESNSRANNMLVEIGTPQTNDMLRLTKWDEAVFEIRLPQATNQLITNDNDMIRYSYNDFDSRFYMKDDMTFEWEIVIDTVSPSISLTPYIYYDFNFTYNDLEFYYQAPLNVLYNNFTHCDETDCWTDSKNKKDTNWVNRPANIVDSYAVYHKDKINNKYQSGKAFSIERINITDEKSGQIYGTLNITIYNSTNGRMRIGVPRAFHNNADSIIIDPAFGYDTCGGTNSLFDKLIGYNNATLTENGTLISMSACTTSYLANNISLGIYNSGGFYPTTKIVNSTDTFQADTWTAGRWQTVNDIVLTNLTSGTEYYLGIAYQGQGRLKSDDGCCTNMSFTQVYGSGFPSTASTSTAGFSKFSLYASYSQNPICNTTTTTCTFESNLNTEDLEASEGIQADIGFFTKWDVSDLCDLGTITVNDAQLQYYLDGKTGSPDNDARIYYIPNQTWKESDSASTMDGLSKNTLNSSKIWSSITVDTYSNISITEYVQKACDDGDSNMSLRIDDVDQQLGTITNVNDATVLSFGDNNLFVATYFQFRPRDYSDAILRPRLFIDYSIASAETPPTVDFVTPTPNNETIANSLDVTINVTCDKNCDGTLSWNGTNETMDGTGTTVNYKAKTNLDNGNYTFKVFVNNTADSSQKNQTGERWVYINVTAPVLTFVDPTPNNENISISSTTINITCDLACSSTLSWNGTNETMSNSTPTIWYKTKTGLSNGNYTFKVFSHNNISETRASVSSSRWVYVNVVETPNIDMLFPTTNETGVDNDFYKVVCNVTNSISNLKNVSLYSNRTGSMQREMTTYMSENVTGKNYRLFESNLTNGTYQFYCDACNGLGSCNQTDPMQINLAFKNDWTSIDGYWLFRISERNADGESFCRIHNVSGKFQQGGSGNGWDTGCMWREGSNGTGGDAPDRLEEDVYCSIWAQYYFDEEGNYTKGQKVERLYCHMWGQAENGITTGHLMGIDPEGEYHDHSDTSEYYAYQNSTEDPPVGSAGNYNLYIYDNDTFDYTILGEELYNFSWIYRASGSSHPQVMHFDNQKSFCLIFTNASAYNDTYLNSTDTDGDGLTDWREMFVTYTDPYDNNTDDDFYLDNIEDDLGLQGYNPYDDEFTTKIIINEGNATGYLKIINYSQSDTAPSSYEDTLDREYTSGEYNTLKSISGSVSINSHANVTHSYALSQTNFIFNISEDVDNIDAILMFMGNTFGYVGQNPETAADPNDYWNKSVQIKKGDLNRSFIGDIIGYRHLFVERILANYSDYLENNNKTLYMRQWSNINTTGTTKLVLSSKYAEVWVTRIPSPKITSPTTNSVLNVTYPKNITISINYVNTSIEVLNITINSTLCTLKGVATYQGGNTWNQNCSIPELNNGNIYNLSAFFNTTEVGVTSDNQDNSVFYDTIDTCTYSGSGNWIVNCTDNCDISSPVDVMGNLLILQDEGFFHISALVYNFTTIFKESSCRFSCSDGGCPRLRRSL